MMEPITVGHSAMLRTVEKTAGGRTATVRVTLICIGHDAHTRRAGN
jgi:methylmalonyl-CoA mutase cobalamin-binding subunit